MEGRDRVRSAGKRVAFARAARPDRRDPHSRWSGRSTTSSCPRTSRGGSGRLLTRVERMTSFRIRLNDHTTCRPRHPVGDDPPRRLPRVVRAVRAQIRRVQGAWPSSGSSVGTRAWSTCSRRSRRRRGHPDLHPHRRGPTLDRRSWRRMSGPRADRDPRRRPGCAFLTDAELVRGGLRGRSSSSCPTASCTTPARCWPPCRSVGRSSPRVPTSTSASPGRWERAGCTVFDGELDVEDLLRPCSRLQDHPPAAAPDLSARTWTRVGPPISTPTGARWPSGAVGVGATAPR